MPRWPQESDQHLPGGGRNQKSVNDEEDSGLKRNDVFLSTFQRSCNTRVLDVTGVVFPSPGARGSRLLDTHGGSISRYLDFNPSCFVQF